MVNFHFPFGFTLLTRSNTNAFCPSERNRERSSFGEGADRWQEIRFGSGRQRRHSGWCWFIHSKICSQFRWWVFTLWLKRNNIGKSTYDQTVKQLREKIWIVFSFCTVFFSKEIGKKIMAPTPVQWFLSMDSSTDECLLTPLGRGSLQPPHVWSSAATKNHVFTWCLERNNIGNTTYDQNVNYFLLLLFIIIFCKNYVFVPFLISLVKSPTKHYKWCIASKPQSDAFSTYQIFMQNFA